MRSPVSLLLAGCLALAVALGCGHHDTPVSSCAVPIADSPTRGPADAWVTAIEFADFECPYCGKVVPTLEQVDTARPGGVRWVYKHLPFHDRSVPAAIAAECAHQQGQFWEMYAVLYAHQNALSDADLLGYAESLGLDIGVWQACLGSDLAKTRLAADGQAADRARVGATPTFFFNGVPLVGALPLEDFLSAIDGASRKAQASRIPAADYYASIEGQGCS